MSKRDPQAGTDFGTAPASTSQTDIPGPGATAPAWTPNIDNSTEVLNTTSEQQTALLSSSAHPSSSSYMSTTISSTAAVWNATGSDPTDFNATGSDPTDFNATSVLNNFATAITAFPSTNLTSTDFPTSSNKGGIVGGVMGALVTLAICAGAYWLWRRRRAKFAAGQGAEQGLWTEKPERRAAPPLTIPTSAAPSQSQSSTPSTPSAFAQPVSHAQDAGPLLLPPAYDPAWRSRDLPPLPSLRIPTPTTSRSAPTGSTGISASSDASNPFEWDGTPEVVRDTKRLLGVNREKDGLALSPFADVHAGPESKG